MEPTQKLYNMCKSLSLVVCNDLSRSPNASDGTGTLKNYNTSKWITVSVSDNPPWNFESPPGSGCFCGIAITLLGAIGPNLNLRFLLLPVFTPLTKFIMPDGAKYEGSPADLLSGKVKMSICPLATTVSRVRHFELITGFLLRNYHIAVHERWLIDSGIVSGSIINGLFQKAMNDTWPGLLLTALCVFCALVCMRTMEKTIDKRPYKHRILWTIKLCFRTASEIISSFFNQDSIEIPTYHGAQLAVLQWLLYAYFAVTLMNANVSSSLAGSFLNPPFQTVTGFVHSGFDPLFLAKTAPIEFMNGTALKPLTSRMRQYDAGSSISLFLDYAASLSQHEKIAIFSIDETPLYQKAGFVAAVQSQFYNYIAIYQLPRQSSLAPDINYAVMQMAKTGSLKRIISVHLDVLYLAYGARFPESPAERQRAASIRMPVLFSTVYTVLLLFSLAGIIFLIELCGSKHKRFTSLYK